MLPLVAHYIFITIFTSKLTIGMNKKLLELFKAKCKDMGLSDAAIEAIVTSGSEGLTDASTDAEIEAKANLILPFAKAMQGEATRWAQTAKEKAKTELETEKAKAEEEAKKKALGGEEKPWEAAINSLKTDYDSKLSTLQKENEAYKAEKTSQERAKTIADLQKKHGIKDEHMQFVSVPADSDPDKFLTDFKQHLITQNLMPAVGTGSAATVKEASEKFAGDLLADIAVKEN